MNAKQLLFIALILLGYNLSYAQPGSLDSSFDPGTGADNPVLAISIQGDGKIIIAGYFTFYNGMARGRITRLNSDGSLDTSFEPGTGANNHVWTTSVQSDGKIIIGGHFNSYNGTARGRIARLNVDGSLDTFFDPGLGADNYVHTTSIQSDGKIIIGGVFTSFNGTAKNNIARLNTDGSLDTSFNLGTGADFPVWATSIQNDGKIIIGGYFTSYNGTTINRIARLNTDGSLDTSFDPGTGILGSHVHTTSIQSDGKIIIGGVFTSFNGTARNNIVRLNIDGSLDISFDPGTGANDPLYSWVWSTFIQSDGKIIIGGDFTSYNGTAINYIARLNVDGSLDNSFDPGTGTDERVYSISIQSNGKIIIGGNFTSYNGTAINRIARLEGTPVGIHQPVNGAENVNIYPNPFSNTTTLHSEVELKNAALTVFNSFGQTVRHVNHISGHSLIFERDNLPSGLYFIRLTQDNQILMTGKLVVAD